MTSQALTPVMDVFDQLFQLEQERPAIRAAGLAALYRLLPVAQRDSGQSSVVARLLLSLYNGTAYPFPLTDLRKLDTALYQDCIAVLHMDNRPEQEVHTYVVNGDAIFDEFKKVWRAWHNQYN